MHPLLLRQLKRSGIEGAPIDAEPWKSLLERVSASYTDAEHDRYLIERSLDLVAKEMEDLNAMLRVERDRLESELAVVARIQRAILPRQYTAATIDIAARMVPVEAVSGDYYDLLPVAGGCFVGIGDVAGHGLAAGMIMLMIQGVVAALVKNSGEAAPRAAIHVLNQVMFENIRHRLEQDDHVTLTLFHVSESGHVTFAGAHEDMVVYRAKQRSCEIVPTNGVWLGAQREILHLTMDNHLMLDDGDTMVLYTDGVVEARDKNGEELGLARFVDAVATRAEHSNVSELCDGLVDVVKAHAHSLDDDVTILALRQGPHEARVIA